MNTVCDTQATATQHTQQEPAANDNPAERDPKGRFQKGNRGGPGNPFARQTAKLRQAMLDAVSDGDIKEAINALKEQARQGDVAAIRLLLSYSIGKPTEAPNPDTLDLNEMDLIIKNHQVDPRNLVQIIQALPVDAMLFMLRAMLPVLFTSKLQMAATVLSQPPDEEDEEDDEPEEEAESQTPRPADPIPEWLKEVVNRDQHQEHRPQQEESREAVAQKQEQLQPAPSAGAAGSGRSIDPELLRNLLQRMILDQPEARTGPIANRPNGNLEKKPPTPNGQQT